MTNSSDSPASSLLIGIAGGSAGGKTSLAKELVAAAGENASLLELDRFYHCLGNTKDCHQTNFDEPAALDFELLQKVLEQLRTHGTASVPKYDFTTHKRVGYEPLQAAPLIIVEGILVLSNRKVRDLLDFRLYVDAPAELRLQRRIKRDMKERGRDAESIEQQWNATVRPMHDKYVEPSRQHADQLIDGTTNLKSTANELLNTWFDSLETQSSNTGYNAS
ncbi:uridine kinase [Rubripirellula sp.]|nr:uridine kinase [Rubripirellula sp.]MDB4633834.1 uridine kinase [Rubripirellula sp.]MDB4654314.1 uridine kinase [Rubripirellula sp.]